MFKILEKNWIMVMVLMMLGVGSLAAQDRESWLPLFDYEIVSFPDSSFQKPNTYLYIWVRNSYLQYVTIDTLFTARYQINVGIYDMDGSSVLTEDKTFRVTENNYAATIDPKIQRVNDFKFQLSPDDYRFEIRIIDLNSQRSRVQERKKTVRSFEINQPGLSDVLFLTSNSVDSIIAENILPSYRIPIQEKIYVYAEIVRSAKAKEIKIESSLKHKDGKEGFTFSRVLIPNKNIIKILLEINKESMIRGPNQLYLKVSDGEQSKIVRKDLQFIAGMESHAGLLVEDMIGPLVYVADAGDWKKLTNAASEEQEKAFQEFWNRRDPNPGSSENELFNEFYKRVEFTNRSFGFSKRMGWKTDRGRVYIVFGPPDRVETSTPSSYTSGTYEIWYYDDLREKFIFLDEYGFGEFRLVSGNLRPAY